MVNLRSLLSQLPSLNYLALVGAQNNADVLREAERLSCENECEMQREIRLHLY